ncbi:MAG TPA: MATE family efflux transporter [Chthonomonadaceae bacterium]|nr:MATE family efflux transporter [Chthonomonadaceae bacterium]
MSIRRPDPRAAGRNPLDKYKTSLSPEEDTPSIDNAGGRYKAIEEADEAAAFVCASTPEFTGDGEDVPTALPVDLPQAETARDLHQVVWQLAWPAVAAMLLQTVNSLMDVFFVGHLPNGAQALAATGIGGSVLFLLVSLAMGLTVGTTALVARFTGAGDHEAATHATGQSLTLAFFSSIVIGLVFYWGRGTIVGWMLDTRRSPQAAALCVQFLSAALLATVPVFVMNVLAAAFRGLGDTRTPMFITGVVVTTHMTFNALLIYGLLGFPRMGVRGAGTAMATSLYVGTILYLIALARWSPLKDALKREHLRLKMVWVARILKIGIPAAVQAIIRTLAMMTFSGVLARTVEGAAAIAAMQIGIRAESLAFMPGFGYSVAASTLVGQSLGARDPKRAERCGWAATLQGVAVMTLMAVLFFTFAVPFVRIFTSQPTVLRLGVSYLRVSAFCEPFLALGMVLTGALQGAGDTTRPTYITIFTMWIVRLPLAVWLMFTCHMEAQGAWYAMTITTILGGLMTAALFQSGKWKRIKV